MTQATAITIGALLRIATVCTITGLSKATIYRLVNAGTFPRPVHITPRCTRWRAEEVAAWSEALTSHAGQPRSVSR